MSSDILSNLLEAVRLRGAVYFLVEAASPWVAETPLTNNIASAVMPGSEHVIPYHVVTRGECWASLIEGQPVRLAAGDVIVFPQGDPHVMASQPGMRAEPNWDAYRKLDEEQQPYYFSEGGDGTEQTQLVCGFLGCDAQPFNPLLTALPRLLHISQSSSANSDWLSQLISLAVIESQRKREGGECALARLSELMFIEVVRCYLESLNDDQMSWLSGLRDRFVGRALARMHERPAYQWTLNELSKNVGLSRSALVNRFTHYVGIPPMLYLSRWRMQLASALLADGSTVGKVALEVGYDSEAAFSRAFKKHVGTSPAIWRKQKNNRAD